MAQCIEVAAKYEKWFMWLVSLPGALAPAHSPCCLAALENQFTRVFWFGFCLSLPLPLPQSLPSATDTAATFVSPPPTGSDTNCCLGFGTERFSWFVCLGHALIELWGFSLRSLQLFYVNYSLQPGVSFSWLSCTFLVSCFLDSRFCFFRPLSALNQVELTASLAQALDNINLYLDFNSPTQYHLFARVSCIRI